MRTSGIFCRSFRVGDDHAGPLLRVSEDALGRYSSDAIKTAGVIAKKSPAVPSTIASLMRGMLRLQ